MGVMGVLLVCLKALSICSLVTDPEREIGLIILEK